MTLPASDSIRRPESGAPARPSRATGIIGLLALTLGVSRAGTVSHVDPAEPGGAAITLPAPPEWSGSAGAKVISVDDIRAEFAKASDTPPVINAVRASFLAPDLKWLTQFRSWFGALKKPLGIRFEDQLWDCDNYANCFVTFADVLTLRGGARQGSLCIGWATVYYEHPFAGIESGPHAVAIAGTREGLFVIEPQDGTMVPLRKYPNRDTIQAVYF